MNTFKKEFIELAKLSGWSQAEIGRRLRLSRGGINGIITGKQVPSASTVEMFRMVLVSAKPEVLSANKYPPASVETVAGMDSPRVISATENLREIHDRDPEAFKEIERVIITYKKAVGRKTNSTSAERVASASAPSALKLALNENRESPPSPKADESTADKPLPKPDTRKRSKSPPESPT